MEKQNIIQNITSKYIIQNILSFIGDNYFFYKLFVYSKSCQIKFEIKFEDYQNIYFIKKINWNTYLSNPDDFEDTNQNVFNKDKLKNRFEKKFFKISKIAKKEISNNLQKYKLNKNNKQKEFNSKSYIYNNNQSLKKIICEKCKAVAKYKNNKLYCFI